MRSWLERLRRAVGRRDARTAYENETRAVRAALATPTVDPRVYAESRRATARGDPSTVVLGTAVADPSVPITLPLRDIPGRTHALVLGAAGAGKSRLMGGIARQIVRAELTGHALGLVVVDPKSELSDLVAELAATELVGATPALRERFVAGFRFIDPFAENRPPVPLNILARVPGVSPQVQAFEVSSALAHIGGDGMGPNQGSFVHNIVLASIGRLTLPALYELAGDPVRLASFAAQSEWSDVRSFFAGRRLAAQSIEGVRSRLHALLRVPAARRCLEASTCLDFSALLGGGISILATGSPPLGCEDISKAFGLLFAARLGRAVFARRHAGEVPVIVVCDEFQETLGSGAYAGETFERLLNLARSRSVALVMASQSLGNVARANAGMPEIALTNAGFWIGFRSSPSDARIFESGLRAIGRRLRVAAPPWEDAPRSPYLGLDEERRLLIAEAASLPPRTFYFWNRTEAHGAVLVRSADVAPSPSAASLARRLLDESDSHRAISARIVEGGGAAFRRVPSNETAAGGAMRIVTREVPHLAHRAPRGAVGTGDGEEPRRRGQGRPRRWRS